MRVRLTIDIEAGQDWDGVYDSESAGVYAQAVSYFVYQHGVDDTLTAEGPDADDCADAVEAVVVDLLTAEFGDLGNSIGHEPWTAGPVRVKVLR